jgi:hypothetical protein
MVAERRRLTRAAALTVDPEELSVPDCEVSEPQRPTLTLRGHELLLRPRDWLPLPFGAEPSAPPPGAAQRSDDSVKMRLPLPEGLGARLLALDEHCAAALRRLPSCEALTWTPSVKRDRAGQSSVNVKVALAGGAFDPPTQFKLRLKDGFVKGECAHFFRTEVQTRGYFRGGLCQLTLRPRLYVMGERAGLYYVAPHLVLWQQTEGGAEEVDAIFPDDALLAPR